MRSWIAFLIVLSFCVSMSLAQATGPLPETNEQRDARMKWWRDARFGMFIHWGLYAIPAGEWKGQEVKGVGEWIMDHGKIPAPEYETLVPQFNPEKFDAKRWARIAKDAGMKYVVITSKHHDGFALFDSKAGDYDVMATPFKRDILKELSEAVRAEGLTMCWYHSIMDWHHPDARGAAFPKYRDAYLKPQLKELLTNYGDIGVMWFDGEWIQEWTEPQGKDLYSFCRSIQPKVIVNNRVGKGRKGMQGMNKSADAAGDFGTPEQEVPASGFPGVDWESCMTMNDTWGFKKNDHNWKSEEKLIHTLIETASKGGNFLLNVGPTAAGEIPQPSVERLAAMGKWMKTNGESIYGTTASPFAAEMAWGRVTQKPGKLFLHVMNWPSDGKIVVPLTNQATKAYLLAQPASSLDLAAGSAGVTIAVPAEMPDQGATVVVVEIKGPPRVIEPSKPGG
ncbi:MAG: alpha-L-fucosidase [Humisphaera sp.]|nr:alpha-L-fucosidase [Humisphaera sp.]